MNRPVSSLFAIVVLLHSCGGPEVTVPTEDQKDGIRALVAQVDQASYTSALAEFANNRNVARSPDEVHRVEQVMTAQWEAWGYTVIKTPVTIATITESDLATGNQYVHDGPFTMNNLIATKVGSNPGLAPILVGAHHDTVYPAPGTNDNGTGCAVLLEVARVLAPVALERTVIFASFAFEEDGLVGSKIYVDGLSDAQLPVAAIVLDTVGFISNEQLVPIGADVLLNMPRTGTFLGVFASRQGRSLLSNFLTSSERDAAGLPLYAAGLDQGLGSDPFLQDVLRSDHTWFWVRNVPSLFLSDTANLRVGNVYHTADDDLAHVNLPFATLVAQAVLSTVAVEAGLK